MLVQFDGVQFGGASGPLIITGFDPGRPEIRFDDVQRPHSHGIFPSREYLGAALWVFEIATNARDHAGGLVASASLEEVWRRYLDTEEAQPLDYHLAGRWRTVFGKPRRFASTAGTLRDEQGVTLITCDFTITDPRTYDTLLRSQRIGLVAPSTGGLVEPLIAPLVSTRTESTQSRFVEVGGNAPTPLTVTFHGPLTDPRVVIDGQEVGIAGEVAEDLSITVDGRSQTVVRADGVALPGRLSRRSRLDALLISPGSHEVTFSGVTATGTGHVDLSWRDAAWGL